jgi:anti-sigma-K factor RskA
MNEHPHDALPAFALGALDADEASQLISHVAACPACRDDVEAWGLVVAMLPYAVPLSDPPAHVKRRLLTMVEAAAQPGAAELSRGRLGRAQRWMGAAAAASLALALIFGLLFMEARRYAGTLTAQIGQRDQQISQMRGQLVRERQEAVFISADNTVGQPLARGQGGAWGKMYMQPGSNHAVLVVYGLKQPEPGKVYQFWFATERNQVPSTTFTVGPEGMATVTLEAPARVDAYAQVMVTLEQAPGSQTPSDEIVLQGRLST